VSAGDLLDYTYPYDNKGNVKTILDSIAGLTMTFTYDDRDRLKQVSSPAISVYEYDKIGNMTRKTELTSSYNPMAYGEGSAGPHAITSATHNATGVHTFEYDLNGNMLVQKQAGSPLHEYAYDADGKVSYRKSSGVEEWYTYDYEGNLLVNSAVAGYSIYIGGIYEVDQSGAKTKYYFVNGQRFAMRLPNGNVNYITGDHLGSTSLITDQSGALVSRTRYHAYGSVRQQQFGVGYSTVPTDKMYTGQQRETMNGIYHYNARLYNTDIGRFPQADTITPDPGDPQALNRYSYVRNNPTNGIDPTGHAFWFGDGKGSNRNSLIVKAFGFVGYMENPLQDHYSDCYMWMGGWDRCGGLRDEWVEWTLWAAEILAAYTDVNLNDLPWANTQRFLISQRFEGVGAGIDYRNQEVLFNQMVADALPYMIGAGVVSLAGLGGTKLAQAIFRQDFAALNVQDWEFNIRDWKTARGRWGRKPDHASIYGSASYRGGPRVGFHAVVKFAKTGSGLPWTVPYGHLGRYKGFRPFWSWRDLFK
jgi:RHS repeat-associated protein